MSLHQARTTPWRTTDELVAVKSQFYGDGSTPETWAAAVRKVAAWQSRTRIPHAIEATAQITSAILLDSLPSADALQIRMAYSMAICRFVNGIIDPAQQSQFALPMHLLAKNLNLPTAFVEFRHAATHEGLPSIEVLRVFANRGLKWLADNYWAGVGEVGETPVKGLEQAKSAVLAWRRARRENPLRRITAGDSSVEGKVVAGVVKECVGICKDEEGIEALIEALLAEKALVPGGRGKEKMMKGAKMLWTPLLGELEKLVPGFVRQLVDAIVEILKASEELSSTLLRVAGVAQDVEQQTPDEEFVQAISTWARYLTDKKQTAAGAVGAGIDIEMLVRGILLQPNKTTMLLLTHLLTEYPQLKPKYQALAELAALNVGSQSTVLKPKEKRSLEDLEAEIDSFEERFRRVQHQRLKPKAVEVVNTVAEARNAGKWKRWEGNWIPKPLGII